MKEEKISEEWENCYTGKNIHRYYLEDSSLFFKNNFAEVKAGGSWDMEIHHSKKIVVRQVGNPEPIFAYDKFGFASLNTMYNILVKDENFDEKYILGVLNSNFIKEYWLETFSDNKQLFPKIKGYQLKQLPIPKATPAEQAQIAELVDQIMELKKEMQEKVRKFLLLLEAELINTPSGHRQPPLLEKGEFKLSKKLEKYYELDFSQFLKELERQKIKLSLAQKSEWQEYFEERKAKITGLEMKVERVDDEIEGVVRGLYKI